MPRLAWFTPLPPIRSGISAYSAEILPLLRPDFDLDVFVDFGESHGLDHRARCRAQVRCGLDVPIFNAHDFVWKHDRTAYDLIVYQLGNAPWHDYMWPYLVRHPGLVVLHDGQLHHSRARNLLRHGRRDDYRAELAYNHPDASPTLATFGIAGFPNAPYHFWPMLRIVLESARLTAVHNTWFAGELTAEYPNSPVSPIRMGVRDPIEESSAARAGELRAQLGIRPDTVVFGAFGLVTPEKRILQAINALRAISQELPSACLLLVGDAVDHLDAAKIAKTAGVENRVISTGYVHDHDIPAYLEATDVCLNLRWPSSRETSASWLRCLAAGKPTVVTDLVHCVDVPALDPRTWAVLHGSTPTSPVADAEAVEPVAVSIDILDEDHSLRLAMTRLGRDARLRERLGRHARAFWAERHTLTHMLSDYREVIADAMSRPSPPRLSLPHHLLPDVAAKTRAILHPFNLTCDVL